MKTIPATSFAAALAALALSAALIGTAAALSAPPTTVDASTNGGKGSALTGGFDGAPVTGRITHGGAITAIKPPVGSAPWIAVTITGSGSPATSGPPVAKRTLQLLFTPYELLPVASGDKVDATVECTLRDLDVRVCDLTLTARPDGRLVLFVSGTGAAPAGWEASRGVVDPKEGACGTGDAKCSIRHDTPLIFRHLGKAAITTVGSWRRLTTTDGTWLVTGHRAWWEGLRPPDVGDISELAIARVK